MYHSRGWDWGQFGDLATLSCTSIVKGDSLRYRGSSSKKLSFLPCFGDLGESMLEGKIDGLYGECNKFSTGCNI